MGLVLILIVAIPFLIALIITYIVFGLTSSQSGQCATLCCVEETDNRYGTELPEGYVKQKDDDALPINTTTLSTTTTTSPKKVKRSKVYDNDDTKPHRIRRFDLLPIAALLENIYNDDEKQTLKCIVVIVSSKWVLCREKCAKDKDLLSIRISSPYWSKEGILTSVKNIVYCNDTKIEKLALIEFEKNHLIECTIEQLGNKKRGYMVFWKNKLDLPLHLRQKFEILETVDFEIYQNINCSKFCKDNFYCFAANKNSLCKRNNTKNALIFNEFHAFVGFYAKTLCPKNYNYSIVMYVNVYQYKSWINSVVNKKN